MDSPERRHDSDTAGQIEEALRMQDAFGNDVAQRYLKLRGISDELAQRVLAASDQRLRMRRGLS
jgi:hypothetical protein